MAEQLGVSEETVRRDLAYVHVEGRPGAGYDPAPLYEALESYLGLTASYPFVAVGDSDMLRSLSVIFPAQQFGLEPAAYFSARPGDAGADVGGVPVHALVDLPVVESARSARVAVVACAPDDVQEALRLLDATGIHAVLMLTPVLRPVHPEGMDVTYFRIPCALKALAGNAPQSAPCCERSECSAKRGCPPE
jgi:NADH/NAD ratio-sensing transcriptional regulator Rex